LTIYRRRVSIKPDGYTHRFDPAPVERLLRCGCFGPGIG
jgi:hypothetical protein